MKHCTTVNRRSFIKAALTVFGCALAPLGAVAGALAQKRRAPQIVRDVNVGRTFTADDEAAIVAHCTSRPVEFYDCLFLGLSTPIVLLPGSTMRNCHLQGRAGVHIVAALEGQPRRVTTLQDTCIDIEEGCPNYGIRISPMSDYNVQRNYLKHASHGAGALRMS